MRATATGFGAGPHSTLPRPRCLGYHARPTPVRVKRPRGSHDEARYADHDRWIGRRLGAVAVGMRLLLMSTMKNEKMGRNQTSQACKKSQAQTVWLRRNVGQLCP